MPQSSGLLRKRVAGALLMALGAFALAAPMAAGRWSLAILGIPLIVLSVAEAYTALHIAAACRRERLPDVSARTARRKPPAVEFRPGPQRPTDPAYRNSGDRRFRQDPDRLAPTSCGTRSHGRQRVGRSRMRGAPLVSQSDHRHGAGDWHRRRRLYRGGGVADADGAGRSRDARRGRRGAGRSPGPGPRPRSERDLRSLARRGRHGVADGACRRSHVDADPCRCVPGDPRRPDADSGQLARHQFSLRCDRRGCSDDPGPGDASYASGAPPLEAIDEAARASGVVAPPRRARPGLRP